MPASDLMVIKYILLNLFHKSFWHLQKKIALNIENSMKYPKHNARYKMTEVNFCLNSIILILESILVFEKYEFVGDIRTLANLYSFVLFICLIKSISSLAISDWQWKYLTWIFDCLKKPIP